MNGWAEHAFALVGSCLVQKQREAPKRKSAEAVITRTARSLGFTLGDLRRYDRRPRLVTARHIAMAEARDAGFSLAEIGRVVGRDHSTVLHGIRSLRPMAGAR